MGYINIHYMGTTWIVNKRKIDYCRTGLSGIEIAFTHCYEPVFIPFADDVADMVLECINEDLFDYLAEPNTSENHFLNIDEVVSQLKENGQED